MYHISIPIICQNYLLILFVNYTHLKTFIYVKRS